jgi:hypothetical protein
VLLASALRAWRRQRAANRGGGGGGDDSLLLHSRPVMIHLK